eukprot:1160338-Pelagomonas_calceolata.AAC.6
MCTEVCTEPQGVGGSGHLTYTRVPRKQQPVQSCTAAGAISKRTACKNPSISMQDASNQHVRRHPSACQAPSNQHARPLKSACKTPPTSIQDHLFSMYIPGPLDAKRD